MVVQDGAYGILSHQDQIRARYKAKSMHTEFWPLRADFHRVLIIEMLFPLTTTRSNRRESGLLLHVASIVGKYRWAGLLL